MMQTLWLPRDAYAQTRQSLLPRLWDKDVSFYEPALNHRLEKGAPASILFDAIRADCPPLKASQDDLVLAIRTVTCVGARFFEASDNEKVLRHFLELVSGRRHRIYTAFDLSLGERTVSRMVETRVKIKRFSQDEHSALTHACQAKASLLPLYEASIFTEEIHGCPHNVLGLPVASLYKALLGLRSL